MLVLILLLKKLFIHQTLVTLTILNLANLSYQILVNPATKMLDRVCLEYFFIVAKYTMIYR